MPLIAAATVGTSARIAVIIAVTMVALVILGVVGARAGGAKVTRSVMRVVVGGAAAMAITMLVGKLFGAAIG